MKNSGHRLGASGTSTENTLEGYRASLGKPGMRGFRYWEFDIRESSDGIIFVFHDDTISVSGKYSKTSQMTFSEIKKAGLQQGISIPLFSEVCDELGETAETVMVEIKHLNSENGRSEVLEALRSRGNWKAMATPERFSRTFPSDIREDWGARFESAGVELVRVGRHRVNLFDACKSRMGWFFAQPRWLFGM
tara:strand:+ start:233 stop:808 length:576 start_codon:yes stop_codon:yes gene_type:complete